ncbi:MAG: mycoredoxin [Actinomycetia bacterium]|nr:mycoredoxin [Actinomycetes bacterium]
MDATIDAYLPEPGGITMFTTQWCGYCRRLKAQLEREDIHFTEIDIEATPDAAEVVVALNGGNRTVPTVVFPDGTSATNPSLGEVTERLAG